MKRILPTPGSSAGGSPPNETQEQTIQRLTALNAELRGQLEKYIKVEAQRAADEKIIAEKMARGLSRQQAVNVIRRQREFDTAAKSKSQSSKPKSKGN